MRVKSLLIFVLLTSGSALADQESAFGEAVELHVDPLAVRLVGPRCAQQILVSGRYADGSLRDLTADCQWKAADAKCVEIKPHGYLRGVADGQTHVQIRVAGRTARVTVTVAGTQSPRPVSFRHEFMPVLSAAGCSDIRCHGAPSGKSGFRLSLWGHQPELDFGQLTRDALGRRTSAIDPSQSLILLKATGKIPHVGRQRFQADSDFAKLFNQWQSEGMRDDPNSRRLASLLVSPASRVLHAPASGQQLAVRARFAAGREVDVTRLTSYTTTDLAIASVNGTGRVKFKRQGEVSVICRFLDKMETVRLTYVAPPPEDFRWANPPENNFVDRHVFAKLKRLHIQPSAVCTDRVFIRRVYLDFCGVLPKPEELESFLADSRPDKRSRLIDQLLQRSEFADYWTKKWLDVLRVSRDSINLAGARAYQNWLRTHLANDTSFAQVVTEMLSSSGESYRDPATNFYCAAPMPREVEDPHYFQKDMAESTAQLFLGIRLRCAQCHNHPFERWTQDDYLSLAAYFTQVNRTRLGKEGPSGRPERRQIAVALDLNAPDLKQGDQIISPHTPGQFPLKVTPDQDRRKLLADWITATDNPFFAKAVVNRVWFHLHGRGIVDPVDDFRDSNPSSNDALLAALAEHFVARDFKLKSLIRAIANSRTYQLSSEPNESNRRDARYFSHMFARPLPAEVLLDAISEVTRSPESFEITKDYTVGIPDGTVRMPVGTRAVQLPVTDIVTLINTSGKYVRYELHPFLRAFGQPKRAQTCECDREQSFGRKQALELVVGPLVLRKLTEEGNRIGQVLIARTKKTDAEILNEFYVRALSRKPSADAAKSLLDHVAASENKREAWEDVLWTILNSQEFIYQH